MIFFSHLCSGYDVSSQTGMLSQQLSSRRELVEQLDSEPLFDYLVQNGALEPPTVDQIKNEKSAAKVLKNIKCFSTYSKDTVKHNSPLCKWCLNIAKVLDLTVRFGFNISAHISNCDIVRNMQRSASCTFLPYSS